MEREHGHKSLLPALPRRRVEDTGPKVSVIERKVPFFLISRQMLRGNKWTLALVVVLMAVAFINLIFVNALFKGVVKASNDQIITTSAGNITMSPPDGQELFSGASAMMKKVRAVEGVESASLRTFVPGTLSRGEQQGSFLVHAVDPDAERETSSIAEKTNRGAFLRVDDADGIVIGRQVAGGAGVELDSTSLGGAKVGDTVTLHMDGVSRKLVVRGIFNTKYQDADREAYISQKTLEEMAPEMADKGTRVMVRTERGASEETVIERMRKAGIEADFKTWKQVASTMGSISDSFVTINALLTTVGFIIAAVVIFIIVYVDISNKRRQVGILRAIGIKSYLVSSTYILQAMIYAVLGVMLGAVIFFAVLIPYFMFHPFELPIGDVTLFIDYIDIIWRSVTVIAVAILSGLLPALIATRKPILDEIAGR